MQNPTQNRLDYARIIISKVSFDKKLMAKEFFKFHSQLNILQRIRLKQWLRAKFQMGYHELFLIAYQA